MSGGVVGDEEIANELGRLLAGAAAQSGGVMIEIRRVQPGDESLLRDTRLRALADAPAAFGTTLASAQARPNDFWTSQAAGSLGEQPCATWIAVDDRSQGIGMLTGVDGDEAVEVIQVWVAPEHRGTGLIERLFGQVFEWAPRPLITIAVAASNGRARRVYERLGFTVTGERPGIHEPEIELAQSRSRSA
jgi:ribosomal protein S18 acetylase RimI-like enzyme